MKSSLRKRSLFSMTDIKRIALAVDTEITIFLL